MWRKIILIGAVIVVAAGLLFLALFRNQPNQPTTSQPTKTSQTPPSKSGQGSSSGGSGGTSSSGNGGQSSSSGSGGSNNGKSGSGHSSGSSSGGKRSSSGNGGQSSSSGSGGSSSSSGKSGQNNPSSPQTLAWGIDTASQISSSFYQCVADNYGKPVFVGRYMLTKQGVYSGLSSSEVALLHHNGVKILAIYNHFTNAKDTSQGQQVAQQAINRAKQLGIPKGTVIFADIESNKPINASFIIGWTQTLLHAGYKPGIYGNFVSGQIKPAYNQAAKQNNQVKTQLILWSNQPIVGVTGKSMAPNSFKVTSPNQSQTYLWQYGINGSSCNIDSDLAKGQLLPSLW